MAYSRRIRDRVKTIALIALGLITVLPLFLMFVASLKSDRLTIMQDFGSLRAFWVDEPVLTNYLDLFARNSVQHFTVYFRNSLLILAASIFGTIAVSSMAGYSLLRGHLRIHKYLLTAIIAMYIIPIETIVLPLLYQVTKMGMLDTYAAQVLPFIASPIYIFLFYQFMKHIPASIGESAALEGAGFWGIYARIYMPMSGQSVATVAILQGMDSWNQFLWPLLITQTEKSRPVSVAIASYMQVGSIEWNDLMAASVLTMLPVLILFFAFQKYFISSVASSAIKE
jgi:multiple sugar transport system permease protein